MPSIRPAAHLLASAAVAAVLALSAAGCTTTGDDTTGSIGPPSAAAHRRRLAALARRLGRALPRQPERCRGRHRLCAGAARHRAARPGRRRAGTGVDPQSAQQGVARRLWPRAGRCRQLQTGARRARPRAYARPAGLAHPQRARRGARPDGPPRGGATPLFERRSRSCRTSRRSCPISACPTRSRRT